MKIRLIALLLAFCCPASARETWPSDPAAVAFMKQTVATYLALQTYQDRGRSSQTLKFYPEDGDAAIVVVEFSTSFKRPRRFKFEWTTSRDFGDGLDVDKNAIWSDGAKVWSWSSNELNPEREDNLNMAVAGATGISQGMAHEIFRLLSDEVTGFRFDQLKRLKLLGSEKVGGVECTIVHGFQYDNDVKLWIGKEDHLIRKGVETTPDTNTNTFERTDIVVDGEIADADFVFRNTKVK